MNRREGLYTAARRYCIEHHANWAEAYAQLDAAGAARKSLGGLKWEYTPEAYGTFPRYLVWDAILAEVERLVPESFATDASLRDQLIVSGQRAETMMTSNPALPASARAAMDAERAVFREFVLSLSATQLESVQPLEMRRRFEKDELNRVWAIVNDKWDVNAGHYWWPLRTGAPPFDAIAFHTDWFDIEKIAVLRTALTDHGVGLIWELRELGETGCEHEVGSFAPAYDGEEGFWTSTGADWLVYASHESSITIAGNWLVQSFRKRFPDCDQFLYAGPMSTPDQRGSWK